MKLIDNAKAEWNKLDEEDKAPIAVALLVGGVVTIVVAMLLVLLAIEVLKALLPFIVGAVVFYGLGVWQFGWPLPPVVKKLFK